MQWWFKKFCKGDERLEDEEGSGWSLKVDSDQLRAIIQADPLTTTQEVAKELNVEHSMVFGIWNKLERWKSSISGCLMGWLKNKKSSFWSVIAYSAQQQIISQLAHDVQGKVDFTWHRVMTSLVLGLRKSSKALTKAKLAPGKRSWSWLGSLLLVWSIAAFWILMKALQSEKYAQQINEIH